MKRRIFFTLAAVMLVALLAAGSGLYWLLGTTDGARWLLSMVARVAPLRIEVRQVEGTAGSDLRLQGVRVTWGEGYLEANALRLRWQPLFLFSGMAAVRELSLEGVVIQDNSPASNKAPDLRWPRVSGMAASLEGWIDELRINHLSYRHLDGTPVTLTALSTSLAWHKRVLTLGRLDAAVPEGTLAGRVTAGFDRPLLAVDLTASLAEPVSGFDRLTLRSRLSPGRSPEQLAGKVAITALAGKSRTVDLAGVLGMTTTAFNLRELKLSEKGRRGTVTGSGSVTLARAGTRLQANVKLAGVDLARELGMTTDLSGTVSLSGSAADYRGEFSLANRGKEWRTGSLTGAFSGSSEKLSLRTIRGALLDGTVTGALDLGWREGFSLSGSLHGSNLNPARITPDWSGVVNLDLQGSSRWAGNAPPVGELALQLNDSRLRGQPLRGEAQLGFGDDNLRIGSLFLQGNGFDLKASGEMRQRLALSAAISDLSGLVPGARGTLTADGWLRYRHQRLSGSLAGRGRDLAAEGITVGSADLTATIGETPEAVLSLRAALRTVAYGGIRLDSATLEGTGTRETQTLTALLRGSGVELTTTVSGAYRSGHWQGRISRFDGHDATGAWQLAAPADIDLSSGTFSLAGLALTGTAAERLVLSAALSWKPLRGSARASWQQLNLARASQWLPELQLAGTTSGAISTLIAADDQLVIDASAEAAGQATADGQTFSIQKASLTATGSSRGTSAALDLQATDGGVLQARFTSPLPARLELPGEGNFTGSWQKLDLALVSPWLPPDLKLTGILAGDIAGRFLPGNRLEARGKSAINSGELRWRTGGREITAGLRTAEATWDWHDDSLGGTIDLALAERGEAKARFQIPLPARLPTAITPDGPLRVTLGGSVQEKGLITSFFPGLIQESHGTLDADMQVSGSWRQPALSGKLHLASAGAYLPTAGIQLKDIQATGLLEGDQLRIDSFSARSGPGTLGGTAVITLKEWQVASYRGTVNGERFQTVYHPELQLQTSPKLTFEGTPARLAVRGELVVPELLVFESKNEAPVQPSPDVVMEGAEQKAVKELPLELDLQVRVSLGDRVLVKVKGIDAQLGGALDLIIRRLGEIRSRGEIRVVKGRYSTYGVNLDIERGRVYYTGGSISQPSLDILALNTVGDVKAGVTVSGTAAQPVIKLYSEPAMPDVDVLAYIVLGHPLGSSSGDASLMMQAAGFLLSSAQSVVLQDQLKQRLGIDVLKITSARSGTMPAGYKPVAVAVPGSTAAASSSPAGISQAMVTVGKYLTPELYLSYGRSLFSSTNIFSLRYSISKRWEIETQTGTESGADLYYKIDFN